MRARSEEIAGITVTHPDRVLYPDAGCASSTSSATTRRWAEWPLPHLRGRPLTLKQCAPNIDQCRYLRHSGDRAPSQVRIVKIREQKKIGDYMILGPDTLV